MTGPEALERGFALLREARQSGGRYRPDAADMIAEAHAWFAAATAIAAGTRTYEGIVPDQDAWRRAAAPEDERKAVAA